MTMRLEYDLNGTLQSHQNDAPLPLLPPRHPMMKREMKIWIVVVCSVSDLIPMLFRLNAAMMLEAQLAMLAIVEVGGGCSLIIKIRLKDTVSSCAVQCVSHKTTNYDSNQN
jgi:hypothetical protein